MCGSNPQANKSLTGTLQPDTTSSPESTSRSVRKVTLEASIDGDSPLAWTENDHHTRPGGKPINYLLFDFGVSVLGGDNLDREIRSAGPVVLGYAELPDPVPPDKGRVRCTHRIGIACEPESRSCPNNEP
jgi:hypothetical protein